MTTTDPNINASAESVADSLDGILNGTPLSYALVNLLQPSTIFSLGSTYPESESLNQSSSRLDQITTLAKVLTRTFVASDGKSYDIWDAVMTVLESVLAAEKTA